MSGSDDSTVKLWDVTSGECLHTFEGHTTYVTCVSFSSDESNIASGSKDRAVKLWCVTSGECLRTLVEHGLWVTSVSFSPDGHKIASGTLDAFVIPRSFMDG